MKTRTGGDWGLTAAVGGAAGALFAATSLPGMHWHDQAEFAAVGWRLSLSHPPGHPAHAIMTHAAERLLPFGDLAFRANLLSGLLIALALAGLFRLMRSVAPSLSRICLAAGALLPAVMPSIWLQGVRAEVYALQVLLSVMLAAGCLAVGRGDRRALAALALTFGIAGANHSLIGLFWLPLALVAMAIAIRRLRSIVAAVGAGALGLATYLYLPLRATAGDEVGWGRPESIQAVWHMISARDWARGVVPDVEQTPFADNLATLVAYVIGQVGLPAAALLFLAVLAALPLAVRRRDLLALGIAAAVVIPFASRVIYAVDVHNPDLGGYVAGGLCAGVALIARLLDGLPARLRRLAGLVLPIALVLAAPGFDPGDRRDSRSAERFALALRAEVPPGGIWVSSDYATAFQGWALRALYGARPDIAPIFRGRVDTEWQAHRLGALHPEVAARLPTFPTGFDGPEVRYEPGVEMHRLGPIAGRLRPVGMTLAVGGPWPDPARLERAYRSWPPDDFDSRRSTAFVHAQHAAHLLATDAPPALVRWHLDRGERFAPGDQWLAAMRARVSR